MDTLRLLLAEDHLMMAEALQGILEADFDVVATVRDGRALVEAAIKLKPDVIVADISMPGLNGFEAARELKKGGLPSKIIFLTMHADVPLAREAFRVGASGYILKQGAARELAAAIRQVMAGNRYITPLITGDPEGFLLETQVCDISSKSQIRAVEA